MAVLASDSFNRADSTSTLGSTDSYAGGTSKSWSVISTAVWGVLSNQAYTPTPANDSPAVIDMVAQADNVRVSVSMAVVSGIFISGLAFRVTDNRNYFRVYASTTAVHLQRFITGSNTEIGSATYAAVTAPFTLSVELSGTSIKVYVNGNLQISVTDTNFTSATKHGMYIGNGTPPRLDNFQIESLATSGTAYTKSLVDSFAPSDTISKRLSAVVVDNVGTAESISKAGGSAVNVSDSLAITDSIRKTLSLAKFDAVTAGETDSSVINHHLSDAFTQSDVITVTGGKSVLLSDSVGFGDSIGRSVGVRVYDVVLTTETFNATIPNAPTIIGTITLSGNRELNVALIGTRVIDVTLRGDI